MDGSYTGKAYWLLQEAYAVFSKNNDRSQSDYKYRSTLNTELQNRNWLILFFQEMAA